MPVKVAINGFGRIGRLVLRAMIESGRDDVVPIAINDLGSTEANAHLFRYDSVHGRFPGEVEVSGDTITIRYGGRVWGADQGLGRARSDQGAVPGRRRGDGMHRHLHQQGEGLGADHRRRAQGADLRPRRQRRRDHRLRREPQDLTKEMTVVSNASCTTNCLAPMAKVLHDNFGILRGYMVTIHAYTGDQNTVDTLHKDLHRARAAAVSAIPTSTGAARAVGLVMPELKGKLDGTAIRIPTPNVSLVSLDVNLKKHGDQGRDQRGDAGRVQGRAAGHPRLQHRAAGQHRLQPLAGVAARSMRRRPPWWMARWPA